MQTGIAKHLLVGLSVATLLTVFGCGGSGGGSSDNSSDNTVKTPAEVASALETEMSNIGVLSRSVDLPLMPEKTASTSSIQGVDSNNNGTRDDLEQIAYQGLQDCHLR